MQADLKREMNEACGHRPRWSRGFLGREDLQGPHKQADLERAITEAYGHRPRWSRGFLGREDLQGPHMQADLKREVTEAYDHRAQMRPQVLEGSLRRDAGSRVPHAG